MEDETSQQKQRKQELLASMGLDNLEDSTESLSELMNQLGREARARGLTPEILESILRESPEEPPVAH